jgi:hypothetical protein
LCLIFFDLIIKTLDLYQEIKHAVHDNPSAVDPDVVRDGVAV